MPELPLASHHRKWLEIKMKIYPLHRVPAFK
jgi:hypothetical protein